MHDYGDLYFVIYNSLIRHIDKKEDYTLKKIIIDADIWHHFGNTKIELRVQLDESRLTLGGNHAATRVNNIHEASNFPIVIHELIRSLWGTFYRYDIPQVDIVNNIHTHKIHHCDYCGSPLIGTRDVCEDCNRMVQQELKKQEDHYIKEIYKLRESKIAISYSKTAYLYLLQNNRDNKYKIGLETKNVKLKCPEHDSVVLSYIEFINKGHAADLDVMIRNKFSSFNSSPSGKGKWFDFTETEVAEINEIFKTSVVDGISSYTELVTHTEES